MSVMYIRNEQTGEFEPVPSLVGPQGPPGANGGGAGTVISVNKVAPDATGNVTLTAANVGALPSGGTAVDSAKLGGKTWAERLLDVYPVGSIYMSANSTSPASLFGGTWEQLKDRFMLGAGDTYAAGSTGGAGNHTHNLSNGFAQLAANGNEIYWDYKTASFIANWSAGVTSGAPSDKVMTDAVSLGGQTDGASNIPPYLAVYMWKRVS